MFFAFSRNVMAVLTVAFRAWTNTITCHRQRARTCTSCVRRVDSGERVFVGERKCEGVLMGESLVGSVDG